MPSCKTSRRRTVVFLLLRLLIFGGVTYLAVVGLLLRPPRVEQFSVVEQTGLSTKFRALSPLTDTRSLEVLGITLASMTTERTAFLNGPARQRRLGLGLIWFREGDDFYPRPGASVYAAEGTNYIDYAVMHPLEAGEWKFKVDYHFSRKFQIGPFRFQGAPHQVIYWSPVMTNSLKAQETAHRAGSTNSLLP